MDYSDVIELLLDEKAEIVKEMRKLKRKRRKSALLDNFARKICGDVSYAEEITAYEQLVRQYDAAIKRLGG